MHRAAATICSRLICEGRPPTRWRVLSVSSSSFAFVGVTIDPMVERASSRWWFQAIELDDRTGRTPLQRNSPRPAGSRR